MSLSPWSVTAVEIFFYGTYLVIFGLYLHVLRTRGMAQRYFLTAGTSALFILSTVHCALEVAISILDTRVLKGQDLTSFEINLLKTFPIHAAGNAVYVTSTAIADSIFIFRCYAIWNFQRKIIIFPTFLTFVARPVAISLFTTVILMGLTVGRIWWLARAAQLVRGRQVADRYRTVCAMILESGALYCVGGIVFLVLSLKSDLLMTSVQTGTVLGQLVGIAPTIIAVRVGLGYSVENVDSFIAPQPRTCPLPHLTAPTVESQVLHVCADEMKAEVV
ncbi:hypothetical protein DFH09DRAFT_1488852 [Mycena vulgaris]|nr:hypothetical protein DFH09DRAFT_1488852 [Mycena vulgaris]